MTGPTAGEPARAGRAGRGPSVDVEPVKSTRIYEEIVRQIKAMIAEGRLKSGDRLPPERELAEGFVVSRTSVREALRTLESLGLVEIRPGEGAFVREASVEAMVGPLAMLIATQREATADLFEARRLLEPGIARLAARRASDAEIGEMQRILDEQEHEVGAGGTGLAQDARFHGAMAAATHNGAITRIAGVITDLLAQSREESLTGAGRARRSHQDHRRVLAAIVQRDPAAAEQAMREHVDGVERLLTDTHRPDAGT